MNLLLILLFGIVSSSGTTGFPFLKLGVGARPVGMEEAFTAISDDGNALFWNPAGLAMGNFHTTLMAMTLYRDVSYLSGGMLIPTGKRFGAGIGFSFLSAQDTRRNEVGEETGSFSVSDFGLSTGLAYKLHEYLSFGGSLKLIHSRLDVYTATSPLIDFGVLWSPISYLYLGSSLLHLGPPRRFIERWEYPPTNLRTGVAFKFPLYRNQFILASDMSIYPDVAPTLSFGGELRIELPKKIKIGGESPSIFTIRGGYKSGYHLGIWSGFSFSIGYEYQLSTNLFLALDAVYFSYGYLGESARVSFSLHYLPTSRHKRSRRIRYWRAK